MCNFRINEEVVCVKTHPDGVVKEGLTYTIRAIKKEECSCGYIVVDVGVVNNEDIGNRLICQVCGAYDGINQGVWWFDHKRFAPLQTQSEEADMNEALQEVFERELFEVNH